MLSVAILITVFNRRDKTLACLDNCMRQFDSLAADGKYSFTVFLVDDGSTDGTADAVAAAFPSVRLIRSEGGLYWNRGMRLAWSEAAKEGYDFYLWLNDDTVLKAGALATLMETSEYLRHKAIVAGTCQAADGTISYGGRLKSNKLVEPDPVIPVPCFTFNGNIVLVPSAIYKVLGNLEPAYHHTFGDYDYGVRARKAGFARVVAPGVLAVCDRNPGPDKWRDASYPLKERYAALQSPKGRPTGEQFLYDSRCRGVFWAVGHMVSVYLKMLFPKRNRAN